MGSGAGRGKAGGMKLRVSEKSWHLRYVRWFKTLDDEYRRSGKEYVPVELCGYFWTLMASCAFGLFFLTVLIFFSPMWVPALMWEKFWEWRNDRWPPVPKVKTRCQSNILVEFIKAKKRKVCPLIEVVP